MRQVIDNLTSVWFTVNYVTVN